MNGMAQLTSPLAPILSPTKMPMAAPRWIRYISLSISRIILPPPNMYVILINGMGNIIIYLAITLMLTKTPTDVSRWIHFISSLWIPLPTSSLTPSISAKKSKLSLKLTHPYPILHGAQERPLLSFPYSNQVSIQ